MYKSSQKSFDAGITKIHRNKKVLLPLTLTRNLHENVMIYRYIVKRFKMSKTQDVRDNYKYGRNFHTKINLNKSKVKVLLKAFKVQQKQRYMVSIAIVAMRSNK